MIWILTVFKYIFIVVTGIFPVYEIYVDGNKRKLLVGSACLILLTLALQITTDILESQEEKEADSNFSTLRNKNDSLKVIVERTTDSLTSKLSQADAKLDSLREDNLLLVRTLTESSIETNRNLTGYGYGVFRIWGLSTPDSYEGRFSSQSDYQMYDMQFRITNVDSLTKCKTLAKNDTLIFDEPCFFKYTHTENQSVLGATVTLLLDYKIQTKAKRIHLEARMISRHIKTVQLTVIELSGGNCLMSYRLYKIHRNTFTLLKQENQLHLASNYFDEHFWRLRTRAHANFPR
jgi:hypothetical protein